MQLHEGQQRWIVDVREWQLSEPQIKFLYTLLSEEESARVARFLHDSDRRLALGSRLLQRALIGHVLGVEQSDVLISRTSYGKPFCANLPRLLTAQPERESALKQWNYNVSHHGSKVVIISEADRICGVDILDGSDLRPITQEGGIKAYLRCFENKFAPQEWAVINQTKGCDRACLTEFYRHWAMKEAYIKALGCGLSYDLQRIRFEYITTCSADRTTAVAYVDGIAARDWLIELIYMDSYIICVALGPASSPDTLLAANNCSFTTLTLADIIPSDAFAALQSV
jgi:4'-phosphopantetheinyl transferase